MNGKRLLYTTVYLSLIVQIVTGLVTIKGLFYELSEKDAILREILGLETVVQFIEAMFYFYMILAFNTIKTGTVAARRYTDWVITTPIMILSTIMFMNYKVNKDKIITMTSFIKDNFKNIALLFLFNFLMLVSGFLGEIKKISKNISIPVGFVFFAITFYIMKGYVGNEDINKKIYTFMLLVWALYGVAAMLPTISKNISYNILDIISKNFYGLFIFYKVKEIASRRI